MRRTTLHQSANRWAAATAAVLLLLGVFGGSSCGSQSAQTEGDPEIRSLQTDGMIRVTKQLLASGVSDTVRIGRLRAGEIAMAQFWLANETDAPIVPAEYQTSCGCATLQFENQPLQPGHAREVTLFFDSRGEWGWQFKRVDLIVAGAGQPIRLYVEAQVE